MLFPSMLALLGAALFPQAHAQNDMKTIPLRTHSISSPYLDSDLQSRWFDFGGDTVIRADRYIRLAADRPSQSGWLFSRVPLTATSWEIEVEFSLNGAGNLFGDGMAMFVTKQRAQQGPVFGFQDKFEGLAILIDTYKNNRPGTVFPYVMAMMGDGNAPYDQANDGKANELAGCSARGLRNAAFPTKLRLTHIVDKQLKLELMYKKEGEWTECFDIGSVKLPTVTYLGFSAETGELSDNHDIIRVETKNLYNAAGSAAEMQNSKGKYTGTSTGGKVRETSTKSGGSWTWFFLKFLLFGLCIAGAYVGFTVYRTRRRDRF